MVPVETRLGMSFAALGVALLPLLAFVLTHSVYASYLSLLPVGLAGAAVYHAMRAERLLRTDTNDAEAAGERAFHFSVFSLSISGIFYVVAALAVALVSGMD